MMPEPRMIQCPGCGQSCDEDSWYADIQYMLAFCPLCAGPVPLKMVLKIAEKK